MLFTAFSFTLALVSVACALVKRDAPLADGNSMQYGTLSNGLQWQASGVLKQGCSSAGSPHITSCYSLSFTNDPTKQLDPGFPDSPRQRIEFLTPTGNDGTSHTYTWKYYLAPGTGSTTHFFHLMQVFSRGTAGGAPVITLDAVKDTVAVEDNVRNCTNPKCPSIALSSFEGKTTHHSMAITYGPSGKINYVVKDDSGNTLLSYQATGSMGTGGTYIKFGEYRAAVSGMTIANAALGDFTSS
ncbi:hypothetical protein JAAARDRAFT_307218 [Jaapia argillacea MUCL 33604]|uniref:Polysaccharide lyase family 7 protein n=1 Tax=Jaapia argillacea MUCL 33604 TaxID=933084 RepID=A0A067PNA6_9AGAM|nr:hypothetical protein JAAARDRAFT_307218 [Jaapia argillacea MUCL 33604]